MLERTAPIRNIGKAFRQADRSSAAEKPEQTGASLDGFGSGDAVAEGVRLGYSVIEDQIQQARTLADKLSPSGFGLGSGGGDDIKSLLNRLLRTYGDLTNVWLEVLNAAFGNADIMNAILGKAQPKRDDPAERRDRSERSMDVGSQGAVGAFSFNIVANCPTEADIRFFGNHDSGASLVVQDLRSRENSAPPLDDITLVQSQPGAAVRFVIKVPGEQPPGLYQGLILDQRTDAPIGALGVTVRSS